MTGSYEAAYYERSALWDLVDRRLRYDVGERLRFTATAAMLPAGIASLVDVGTGTGEFLAYLERRRADLDLLGVERSAEAIARRRCRADLQQASVAALPLRDRSVDLVTALELIEHLPDAIYQGALAELARVARSYLLISVPFCERRARVRCPVCHAALDPSGHQRRFRAATLKRLLPCFELVALRAVRVPSDPLSASFLRTVGKHLLAPWLFHRALTCPRCGHHRAGGGSHEDVAYHRARASQGWLQRTLPSVSRPEWYLALYRRRSP